MCHNMGLVGGGGVVSVASGGCGVWSVGIVAGGLWMPLRIAVALDCGPQLHLRFVGGGACGLRLAPACIGCCWGGLSGVFTAGPMS